MTLALSFPLGVATAVYLEEFAPKSRWTDLVEVNINNLAAVPSVIFGLLGLAVFLELLRPAALGAPMVGGLVLALMHPADHHHRRALPRWPRFRHRFAKLPWALAPRRCR